MIRVGELFKDVIRHNSVAIIVVHCHPSGCSDPSLDDIRVTERIVQAGALLDIQILTTNIGLGRAGHEKEGLLWLHVQRPKRRSNRCWCELTSRPAS